MSKRVIRIVSLFIIFAMCITILPMSAIAYDEPPKSGSCGKGVVWNLDIYYNLIISGNGEMIDYVDGYHTPWAYWQDKIESIVIRDGLTKIGNFAFSRITHVTSITIPNSVTSIGDYAFHLTPSLDNVILGNGVEKIGKMAFCCTGLHSIQIPDSVVSIGEKAFYMNVGPFTVQLPDSVVDIGDNAFGLTNDVTLRVKMGSFALNYALEYNLNYEIYGEHVLCGISILHLPNKLSYAKGEVLDLDGGVIQLNYEDGLCDTIDMDQSMVSGFDNSKTGIQWLTVAHSGFMTTFSVSVKDKQLTRLTIKALPVKLQYLIDKEELDITGGVLTLYYDNDTTRDAYMIYNNGYKLMFADDFTLADLIVTGFDNADVGTKTIVVKYEGKIATFDVEVLDRTLIRLEITDMPTKTEYIKGEQLDLSGAKIKMYYDNDTIQTARVISVGGNHRMIIDGSSSSVPLAVDGFFSNNSGIQTIIISYNDCSASFVVKVRGENVIIGDPDGNGEVSVTDALYSMRAILGIIIIVDGDAVMAADIDDDGILTVSDALCILRLAAGLPIKYIVV